MQDNRLQKEKDAAFEDKAWMDMRKLLDKEMPVRKKERAFFWWWGVSGVLLLLLMIGSWFVFNNQKQLEIFTEKTIVAKDKTSSITKKNKKALVLNKDGIEEKIKIEEKKIVSIKKDIIRSNEEPKSLKIIKRSDKINNKIFKGTAHSTALENRIYPSIIIGDTSISLQNSVINPRKALEEITHSSLGSPIFNKKKMGSLIREKEQVALHRLPILELMDLPIVSYEPTFPEYIIPKKSRIDWAIVASLGTFKLTKFNEYSIGIKTQYEWHPKWRIGTGLNYHYFRLNGLVKVDNTMKSLPEMETSRDTGDTSDDTGTGVSPAGGAPDPNEEDMGDLPIPPTEQVSVDPFALSGQTQYLSIPLFMEYQVSSNIKLDVGTAFYYRLATSYESVEGRLKPHDWTSFVGIGYQFTPYFDLRLSYERNWSEKRSNAVNTNFIDNTNSYEDALLNKSFSPLEGSIKLSGAWRF